MKGDQIRDITNTGLSYVDDDGIKRTIDFAQCAQTRIVSLLTPENLQHIKDVNQMSNEKLERYEARIAESKEVGIRQILGEPWADGPYIEFYTEPPTRFDLTEKQYYQFRHTIEQGGWTLFDHS